MNTRFRFLQSSLVRYLQSGITAALAVVLLGLPVAGNAQDTTSTIRGVVAGPGGSAVTGATITVRHEPTGTTRTTTSNATGNYRIPGLRVGGPYLVTLQRSDTYGEERIEQIYISLAEPFILNLVTRTTEIEEIVVSASQQDAFMRMGAASNYGTESIAGQANVNRDFKNIIRQNPLVSLDPTNQNAISIAGMNNRFNSLTVDGVRQNDDFGLNNSGFPTQRAPISIDSIEQISVEIAPFDVSFGGFTGGTINAVTKSGTNEFDGSLAFYHSNENLTGDQSEDDLVDLGVFDDDTTAITFSGPIIKDKLWFFVSYEEFTGSDTSALLFGPAGSGRANEIAEVTQADVTAVTGISNSIYGFDPGTLPSSGTDIKSETLLVKLDFDINENHNLTATFQDVIGNELNPQGSSNSGRRLGLPSNWYDRSEDFQSYSAQLFSQWSDSFSTEVKIAVQERVTGQVSLNGTDFAQMTIATAGGGFIRLGPDIFRHANQLKNDQFQWKIKGDYLWNDHGISFGVERDNLEIFNLFVFQSEGDYNFGCIFIIECATSFEGRTASGLNYRNSFTNDENDGAATFEFQVNSIYLQDVLDMSDQLTIQYGLRYDWYTGSDTPRANSFYQARNSFSNLETLDGRSVLMPRFGFTYDFLEGTTLRGGVGLFSGGNPNVWISNSFSNDGVTIVSPDDSGSVDATCAGVLSTPATLTNVDGFNIAPGVQACMFSGAGDVEATDPDFDIPSTWRINLAAEREFSIGALGDGWRVTVEAVLSEVNKAAEWKELRRTQIGTAIDGRPIYDTPPNYDVILTNTHLGFARTYSLSIEKDWDSRAGLFDMVFNYTYMDAEDVNPSQSSTVSSNFGRPATFDRNNRQLSTSDFEIEHRFNGTLGWSKELFGENLTRVSLFFESRSGKRFSYTMREVFDFGLGLGDTDVWGGDSTFARRDSQLMYVPLVNDPDVIFSNSPQATVNDPVVEASYNAFIAEAGLEGYRGQIMPRNHDTTGSRNKVDLRIQQEIGLFEIPGLGESKLHLYFDIENLGNLLNDDWGRVEQVFFPFNSVAVGEVSINANGQYVYGDFSSTTLFSGNSTPASFFELPSLYKIQLGVRVDF